MDTEWKGFIHFITTNPVCKESVKFFSTIPSTASYMLDSSDYRAVSIPSRHGKSDTSDTFFSQTLNTPSTIPFALALLHKEVLRKGPESKQKSARLKDNQPDIMLLVQLSDRVNGFRDTVHGGMLASLLDEGFSCCVEAMACYFDEHENSIRDLQTRSYTANLSISYRAPVSSPGLLLIQIWLVRREGRKWYLKGRIIDCNGQIKVESSSLWIEEKKNSVI